jgi:predicted GNAT family acetyltransferase
MSEAENCTHIGLAMRIAEKGYTPISVDELEHPLLLTVQDDDRVELVAVQTHTTKMLVTRGSDEAMHCLAVGLTARHWTGQSIFCPAACAAAFVERYTVLSGRPVRLARRLRTFQLTGVTPPAFAPGSMRLCTPSDREILARFQGEFSAEIGEPSAEDDLRRADRVIESQRGFFWMDEQPVALASWAGRTPNGIRINSVYTPPQFRGRGYASNLVAQLTQRLLGEGRMFCFLHTDVSNPTSNKIYQAIGYRLVCDSEEWEFGK